MAAASTSISTTLITDQASISSFNRGPVTATFTPPPSCLSTLTYADAMYFGHADDNLYFDNACYPSSTLTTDSSAWNLFYYSPAQCPLGWSHASTITSSLGGGSRYLSLGASTTVVVCCPSGYHMDDENFGGASDRKCQMSFLSTTSVLNYIYPRSVSGANSWTSTDASNPKDLSTTTVDISYNIYGDGIPILWQSTDLAIFAAATASTTPTISPIISQSSSTSTQQTSTSSTLPNSPTITPISDGLSSGSKIGIGIGIPLAVIAIGLVAFFIYIRRRRRDVASRAIGNELQETQACKGLIPELPNTSGIHEMQAPVHEMYSDNDTIPRIKSQHEVPGQYELAIQDEHSSTHELSSQHELSGQEETPGQHD